MQKCVDRVSQAIVPYDEKIADQATSAKVNPVDQTGCSQHGVLVCLWVMNNHTLGLFSIKASRSKVAFLVLIGQWAVILVSDWLKPTAHGPRPGKPAWPIGSARPRGWPREKMPLRPILGSVWPERDHAPPARGYVATWDARMGHRIDRHRRRKDEAGTFARHLDAEMGIFGCSSSKKGSIPRTTAPREPCVLPRCGVE